MNALEALGYLPFVAETADGLHVSARSVRWVRLLRLGSETFLVGADEEETMGDAKAALSRLVDRQHLRNRSAATNVDVASWHVLESPPVDGAVDAWMRQQIGDGALAEDTVLRYRTIEGDESITGRALVATVRREKVDYLTRLLNDCGLQPLLIGGAPFDYAAAFAGRAELVDEVAAMTLSTSSDIVGILCYHGYAIDAFTIEPTLDDADAADEARLNHHIHAERAGLHIGKWITNTGPPAEGDFRSSLPFGLRGEARVLGDNSPGDYTGAISLAMHALFPGLEGLDFLDPTDAETARLNDERRLLRRTAAIGLAVAGCLAMLIFLSRMLIDWQTSALESTIESSAPALAEFAALERAQRELAVRLDTGLRLAGNRTTLSSIISNAARAVPPLVRLDELQAVRDTGSVFVITFKGHAAQEGAVIDLMEAIDRLPGMQSVRLVGSQRAKKRLKLPVAFEIQFGRDPP